VAQKKIPKMDPKRRGLIIVVDAAYPFDAGKHDLDKNENGFEMFADDPAHRVVQGKAGRNDSVGLHPELDRALGFHNLGFTLLHLSCFC